ncbi:hypothetical protein BGW37DRAFT_507634 [Umbelopsis sp. PMI_123]|nr:hypothetical protein BGW37DRAFT_507634 [Umbelopsis sp. PMI_123]
MVLLRVLHAHLSTALPASSLCTRSTVQTIFLLSTLMALPLTAPLATSPSLTIVTKPLPETASSFSFLSLLLMAIRLQSAAVMISPLP